MNDYIKATGLRNQLEMKDQFELVSNSKKRKNEENKFSLLYTNLKFSFHRVDMKIKSYILLSTILNLDLVDHFFFIQKQE